MFGKYKKVFLLGVASIVIALSFSLVSQTHTASAAEKDGTCSDADKQKGGVDGTKDQKAICTIPDGAGTGTGDKEDATTSSTCAVERIGWLLCPIIQGAGKMADKAFQFLSNNFLETEPELVSSTPDKGTQYAWNIARNLANIMFIVAFLIIIYSQVTGAGITNYGIKKMLPRLIVAAIAVNASYYICQIIVDLTNIMGREIQSFMVDTARGITTNAAMPMGGSFIFGKDSPGTLETIISGVLGLSIVWIFLPFLLLGSGTILITCIILIVILLMRKAFVVLLIVAAPVAFVAYLLPNTEKYFQKWLSMFWKLLLVFPIVGMLMGGGQLASAIILATGSHSTATYSDTGEKCVQLATHTTAGSSITSCNGGSVPFLLGLTAAVIAVAPLLAVGAVLKGALSAAGAIGGKIAGAVETYTKKGGDKAREGYKNSTIGQMRARSKKIRESETRAGRYRGRGGNFNPRTWRSGINRALNNSGDIPGMNGYAQQRGRMNRKGDTEYMSDKAEEFAANQNYMQQFANAQRDFNRADNEGDRHTAELQMRAAIYAAGRSYDEEGARDLRARFQQHSQGQAQRPEVIEQRNRGIERERRRNPPSQADIAAAHDEAQEHNDTINAQNAAAAAAARYAATADDHEEALGLNQRFNRINELADRHEQASAAGVNLGPVNDVDVARELANRENARRGGGGTPPPPGGTGTGTP